MRRLLFSFFAIYILSTVLFAGEIDFKLGGELGFPTGDFGEYYSVGFGANACVLYQINDQIDLVGGLEFLYFGHRKNDDARILRLAPDVAGRFFAEAGLGIALDHYKHRSDDDLKSDLCLRLGAGVALNHIELLAHYRIVSHSDDGESEAFNAFTLSIGYRF